MLYIILVVLPVQLTFPTRRSSDLQRGTGLSTPVNRHTLAQQGAPSAQARYLRHFRAPDIVADRKSTRLNSSHVAISYAVFCLKKKIEIKHENNHQPTTHE